MVLILIAALAAGTSWLALFVLERLNRGETGKSRPTSKTKEMREITEIREITESDEPLNYSAYRMSVNEKIIYLTCVAVVLMAAVYLFYKSIIVSLLAVPLSFIFLRSRSKTLMERRKRILTDEFRYAMISLSSSLNAGKSVENAFHEALIDVKTLFPHPDSYIIRELSLISRKIDNGESVEHALTDFGRRAGVDDIVNFADIFIICKRTGGDLVEIVRRTSQILNEKLEIQQNISVMLAQKRLEAKMLGMIPFGIIAFLSFGASDYMEPLYVGVGRLVMTAALVMLLISQYLMRRMMQIEI